ncbi:MAG: nucleotidyl transferase AbiEii/AbiGii toxin family protein [Pseudomonadota bacterium]
MYRRPHHQRIREVLASVDSGYLRSRHCYFGGGTAITLLCDEFRESVNIDFLVSDLEAYRALRSDLQTDQVDSLFGIDKGPLPVRPVLRADQYGIRTVLPLLPKAIKFEIIFEARISFEEPAVDDRVAGVTRLTALDLAASKLLANSDRGSDDGVMSRDIIDLAMLIPSLDSWQKAVDKAVAAYGPSVMVQAQKAVTHLLDRHERLKRCHDALSISIPIAMLHQRLEDLRKRL